MDIPIPQNGSECVAYLALRAGRTQRNREQRQTASVHPEARRIGCLEGQSRQLSVCFMYVCVHVAAWTHLPLYAATAVSAVQQSRRVHRLLVYVRNECEIFSVAAVAFHSPIVFLLWVFFRSTLHVEKNSKHLST